MTFFSRKVFRMQSYRGMRKNFKLKVRETDLGDMNWLRILSIISSDISADMVNINSYGLTNGLEHVSNMQCKLLTPMFSGTECEY
jgi:hypothetical protein